MWVLPVLLVCFIIFVTFMLSLFFYILVFYGFECDMEIGFTNFYLTNFKLL